eukprot:1140176-Pelagomonas_calceolata.AAC.5
MKGGVSVYGSESVCARVWAAGGVAARVDIHPNRPKALPYLFAKGQREWHGEAGKEVVRNQRVCTGQCSRLLAYNFIVLTCLRISRSFQAYA